MRLKKSNSNSNNINEKLYKKEGNLGTKMITDQLTQCYAAPGTKNKMVPRPSVFPLSLRQWKPLVDKHSIRNQHYHHPLYHFLPQKKLPTPFILGNKNTCPSPWLWHKMVSNSEISWPCPHSSWILCLMATLKNQPCFWLKLLFLSTSSNLNDLTENILPSAKEETAPTSELKNRRIIKK